MSRGDLQEMEIGTKQSKTAVNANAQAADAMPSLSGVTPGQTGGWEDLGGPDPSNYRTDDDSAKLKTPGGSLKQVKDVVNKGAAAAEAMKGVKEDEEFEYDEDEELLEAAKEEEEEEEESGKKKGKKEEEEEEDEEEEVDEEFDIEEGKLPLNKERRDRIGRQIGRRTYSSSPKKYDQMDKMSGALKSAQKKQNNEEFNIEEDVNALLEGEELSEEFQEKARTIFEAALRSKVSDIKEALEEQYTAALAEEVAEIKSELSERLDAYLEYVAGEWMEENALVIEHGLKTEMTESFLQGMRGLFEEHYVSIPEDKYDVLESMVDKLDEMETKLNEQIEKNVSLNKRLAESVADGIFEQVAEGLADTQKDKLASLAESVEFESEEEYREKLETLRESYFPSRGVSPSAKSDTLSEGVSVAHESHSPAMAAYLKSLSAFSK
jgi:hypothetical protein